MRSSASKADIEKVFGQVAYVDASVADEIGFVTSAMTENDYAAKAAELGNVKQMIRMGA